MTGITPSPEVQLSDHERRITDLEELMEGKDRIAGVLERIRTLEDAGLIETAKRAAVASLIALLVTAAPLLGVVLPAVHKLQESIDKPKVQVTK